MTFYDNTPALAVEAEIIHACALRGLALPVIDQMELWEIAASLGLHRVETLEQRDQREITEVKGEYWEETKEPRLERIARVDAERKARALERKRGRKREEVVGAN